MAFVRRSANAAAARAFYHALRQAGARRRPSRAHVVSMSLGWAMLALGVPLGLLLHSAVVLGASIGIGVILAFGPAALYLTITGWLAIGFRSALDAEGWEREEEHLARRRKRLTEPLPFLPIRFRLEPPTVAVGSRWLALRGFDLTSDSSRLVVRSAGAVVAELDLVPQG
ncbi:MAG: hypothetical protein AABX89_01540 [Candidatus Thermoplasmatota archaeon]